MLTKQEILDTNDWYAADYANNMEGFFWKHKSILNDDYTFYMRRFKTDGHTTIIEEGRDKIPLFDGYIESIEELKQITHLCRLHEI